MLWLCIWITFYILCPAVINTGKVLVYPVDGSHWINMKVIIEELHSRGHQVSVVRTNDSWYIKEKSPLYTSITLNSSLGIDFEEFATEFVNRMLEIQRGGRSAWTRVKLEIELAEKTSDFHRRTSEIIAKLFENKELMQSLHEAKYDLVLTDPVVPGGGFLAHYLNIPLVFNVRWTIQGEGHFFVAPSPLSYIPMTGTEMSDKMSFVQRLINVVAYSVLHLQTSKQIIPHYVPLAKKYLAPDVDFLSLFQADLWLMRVDFVFEFPRPTMPNMIYMGGFQCKPAKPLPEHLEDFVQSSGEHGVIIMSLGTLIGELPHDLADIIAAAFAKLPQKVIWRHKGSRPTTLGNNTLIVDWMPQNDLLGHPKVRLFVAHGGTNGVQEAIYHGVPILGLPLIFDQRDNLHRIEDRGAGKAINIFTMNQEMFLQSLQEVLHEPSYTNNMQRLSRLHRDQPMKPLDTAIFWIEFVMRHKGAAHLRTESYKLPWYSYHSIDVILFLLSAVLLILLTAVWFTFRCFRLCFQRKKKHD